MGEEISATNRGAWGGQLEFILTCVGYAVGLGNVWRFPYLTYKNGGGAFLIPYFLMLFMCGVPVFFFEICYGQFASLGPLAIWKNTPLFKGIGIGMVVVSTLVGLYYNILMCYIMYYFLASMGPDVPWRTCNNYWNTEYCLTAREFGQVNDSQLAAMNLTRQQLRTPTEEFFYRKVLQISDGIDNMGGVVWQLALCLLIAWTIVFLVLIKGIKSLGKVVYFTSTFPYLMMTVMLIRGVTLEGASTGIRFYLTPNFTRLSDSEVWSDAASQIFFTLSTCSGGLIAMASYNKFSNNVLRDAALIPAINCATSLFAGFAIFSVLGFMAHIKRVSVDQVAVAGPGLIFVVYPEGIAQLPPPTLWALLFFFMLLTLGFSSQFSIVECVFVALMDEFPGLLRKNPVRPMILRGVCITIFFLISLPMVTNGGFYLFTIADRFAGGFPRIFIGLFELIAVVWVYGYSRFAGDIALMIGKKPNIYFRACWCVISPAAIVAIVVFRAVRYQPPRLGNYVFPNWAVVMGWMMVASVVIWIPVYGIISYCVRGGAKTFMKTAAPLPEWGPAHPENKVGRYAPAFIAPEVKDTSYSSPLQGEFILRSRPVSGQVIEMTETNNGLTYMPAQKETQSKD